MSARYSHLTIRLSAKTVLALAALSPNALAVLCRVLSHCLSEPRQCYAAIDTLRSVDGAELSAQAVRAALLTLCTMGLLRRSDETGRRSVVYRPTQLLPHKPMDAVFIPQEAWFVLQPRELAYWCVRAAMGRGCPSRCKESVEACGRRVRGQRGVMSRATAYRCHDRLKSLGLLEPVSPASGVSPAKSHSLTKGGRQVSLALPKVGIEYGSEPNPPEELNAWRFTPAGLGVGVSSIEAAAAWAGVRLPRPKEVSVSPKPQQPPSQPRQAAKEPARAPIRIDPPIELLEASFADLRKRAGAALGLTHVALTPTGLPIEKQRRLAYQWAELSAEAKADLPLLGDYIAAGGFAGLRQPVWSWVADRLLECLCRAREWHSQGRPACGHPAQLKTVPEEESITETWNALRKAAGMGAS